MKKMTICRLILFMGCGTAFGQGIVMKASFPLGNVPYAPTSGVSIRTYGDIDVNDDGIKETPVQSVSGDFYLDVTTFHMYTPFSDNNAPGSYTYPQQNDHDNYPPVYITMLRREGIAEWVYRSRITDSIVIRDVQTEETILELGPGSLIISDYDQDSLEDVILISEGINPVVRIYGVTNGNPVSPPQDLDIQIFGTDYIISWDQVPSATAYRVLWSSSIDGVSFTRIGYTTNTTFTHRNQADQPKGFYRVMSEDNGTGVVRMVGSSLGQ